MEHVIFTVALRRNLDAIIEPYIDKGYFAIGANADMYIDDLTAFIYTIL